MKRKIRAIIAAVLAATMCAAFTGCGKSDLEKELENAANQLDKEFGNTSRPNNTNNTGNNAASSTLELEKIDPFADIKVTFTGISPNSKINISGGNSNVTYTPSSNSGMRNGDEIEITAELRTSSLQNRYSLTQTSKKITVSGLSSYASKLDDIPAEALNKFRSQAENTITANVCGYAMKKVDNIVVDSYSFEQDGMDFAGYYFLAGKPGFDVSTYNKIYCAYKMRYAVTAYEYDKSREGKSRETEEHITDYQEFYTICELKNIILLDDGTCSFDLSSMKITSDMVALDDRFCNYFGYKLGGGSAYSWYGYSDLDSMFNAVVAKQLESYGYENTVKDIADTTPTTSSDNSGTSDASAADSSESSN